MKTGRQSQDPDTILYQAIAASALQFLTKQVVADVQILSFHQTMAENIYKNREDIELSDEDQKELVRLAWKYHILVPEGLAAQLTPIIDFMTSGTPLPQSPLLEGIAQLVPTFQKTITEGGHVRTVAEILDRSKAQNYEQLIFDSYPEDVENVQLAVYEDDTVQCACDYCERFFSISDADHDFNELNPIQRILAQHIDLLRT